MNLMSLPGQKIEDIRIVQSHPMALLQCQEFLSANPEMKILESNDTAESAKLIFEKKLFNNAAIASELAAETYQLEILKYGIETNQQNYTRFLAITRNENSIINCNANKSSICFEVSHHPGSLVKILDIFSQFDINMTKIQSVPILGRPYQYSFHVDLEWKIREQFEKVMLLIIPKVSRLIRFGEYPREERP
jgi:prephenate dehydratase